MQTHILGTSSHVHLWRVAIWSHRTRVQDSTSFSPSPGQLVLWSHMIQWSSSTWPPVSYLAHVWRWHWEWEWQKKTTASNIHSERVTISGKTLVRINVLIISHARATRCLVLCMSTWQTFSKAMGTGWSVTLPQAGHCKLIWKGNDTKIPPSKLVVEKVNYIWINSIQHTSVQPICLFNFRIICCFHQL